jgi:glycosyltransferase involved in cell wall biosynthesis
MMQAVEVSVVICTYNRCDMLARALESVLAQETSSPPYEVIVVDNNSSDRTRQVVDAFLARGHANLRYLLERRQGLSHARNAGIAAARAPIITFTDDDVRAAADWIAQIKRAFSEHPEVDLVGGKVLPNWSAHPPLWLTTDHWSPLAITDHGNEAFYTSIDRQICLVGANMSVRKGVFDELAPFHADFQRVKDGIGSTEDHEFQLRLWRAGRQGLYTPEVVVTADVQDERLTKSYHRRWHTGHGAFCARMRLAPVPADAATLFGVPAYFYRRLWRALGYWVWSSARRDAAQAFLHELAFRYSISYVLTSYRLGRGGGKRSVWAELLRFARDLLRKKTRAVVGNRGRGSP